MQPWWWWWWLAAGALLVVSCSASDPASSSSPPQRNRTAEAIPYCGTVGAQQLWINNTEWRLLRHAGRMLLASNLTASSSSSSSAGGTGADSPNLESNRGSSTALAVLDRVMQDAFVAAVQSVGLADPSPAMVRYYRVRATRIMLLLSDWAWLIYAIAGFAQRTFALAVPIIKIGQTGQLVLNATSVLVCAQLVADFVARFGDLITKIFLVVFRSKILATTLPPAA